MALKDHEKELEYCTYCPKLCRHACPVSNALGNEALIPQAKMQTLNMLRRGDIPWRQSYVDTLYACTGCKLCQTYCEHDIDVAAILWEGRTEARSRGFVHPTLEHLPEELRQRADDLRVKLEKSHLADRLASEARVGYLPGVDAIETSMGDIDDAFFVFDRLGLDFVRLAEASVLCVAYQLWAGGFIETARHAAEELVRQLRNYATVVVGSAACAYLLRILLPQHGFDHNTEVLHISEFLAPHTERLEVRRRRVAAFYQDPCYLGRYLDVYDAPRRLVARCVESPREFFHHRERAECCGNGGLVDRTYPEAAIGQARHRLEEPQLFGVNLVVTADPGCKRALKAAQSPVEILDLINLIAWSLREPAQLVAHEA